METKRDSGRSKVSAETNPIKDEEHFKYELEFLDTTSKLIEALKKYGKPDRIVYAFDMIGMSRDVYAYPPSLDKYIGKKEFSSIIVTTVKEEEASSTTIEMLGSFGKVYISRDAINPQNDHDQIISSTTDQLEIDRVPDAEINDFLYSMTNRGVNPADTRDNANHGHLETVVGEEMRDALESAAFSSTVYSTYELDDHTKVWFSQEGPFNDEKLTSITLHYRDRDMNEIAADITINKGLAIRFSSPGSENELLDYLHSERTNYVIALRVIREETAKLIKPTEGKRPFSLHALPADLLNEL